MTIEDASRPVENVDECDECLVLLDDNDLKGVVGGNANHHFDEATFLADLEKKEILSETTISTIA